ncbi:hypothetical protein CDD82_6562 [Ophiocordyceps australis]|uniref:Uncharacterized protein n=1 Tax=Ophiocordyceps australis TaxID=1399860 RepID=A0A2C5ZQZ9_9HYPO|nr:hypothetical protein CDD82_6562 [Ophiocordyceps australis]
MGDPLDDDQGPTKRIRVDAPLSQHHSHAPECHSVKRFQPVHEQVQSIACPPHLALPLHSRAWPAGATEPRQELHPTTQHLNTRHAKAQALQRRHPCADDSDTYMLSLDHYHSAQQHMDGVCQPADVTMAPAATPTATLYASWPDSSNAVPLDTSWRWPSTSSAPSSRSSSSTSSPPMPSPSPMVLALQQPLLAGNGVDAGSVHLLSSSGVTSPSVTSPGK